MNLNEKLAKLTTNESSRWKEKAAWRKENRSWLRKSVHIALTVLGELRRRNMTQRELAERMGMSAQQVNKIVKGQENLTLETLDKLERALNIQLLHDGSKDSDAVVQCEALSITPKQFFISLDAINRVYHSMTTIGWLHADVDYDNSTYPEVNIISGNLHTKFPIEGKEKWMKHHTERS